VRLAKGITDKMLRIIVIASWDIKIQEIRLIVLLVFINVWLVPAALYAILVKAISGRA
jgi:hypothetical protein